MDMGPGLAWVLFGVWAYSDSSLAVVLPIAALLMTSLQTFATVILGQAEFTLANYQTALSLGPVRHRPGQQHRCWASAWRRVGVAGDGGAGLDHLPLAARAGAARSNIS